MAVLPLLVVLPFCILAFLDTDLPGKLSIGQTEIEQFSMTLSSQISCPCFPSLPFRCYYTHYILSLSDCKISPHHLIPIPLNTSCCPGCSTWAAAMLALSVPGCFLCREARGSKGERSIHLAKRQRVELCIVNALMMAWRFRGKADFPVEAAWRLVAGFFRFGLPA